MKRVTRKDFEEALKTKDVEIFRPLWEEKFLPFEEAKTYARSLQLKSLKAWRQLCKVNKPHNIPADPSFVYRNKGWVNWADWLGFEYRSSLWPSKKQVYLSYSKAKKVIRPLGLLKMDDWVRYYKSGNKPANIPCNPYSYYKEKGWAGWQDFFGVPVAEPIEFYGDSLSKKIYTEFADNTGCLFCDPKNQKYYARWYEGNKKYVLSLETKNKAKAIFRLSFI